MGSVSAMVLAAGSGSRMRSSRPKAMHVLCGKLMVLYALEAVADAGIDRVIVVVGPDAETLTKRVQTEGPDLLTQFVVQAVPRGTADAVRVGTTVYEDDDLSGLSDEDDDVVVLPGDLPLVTPATIAGLVEAHRAGGHAATVLTGPAPALGSNPVVRRGRAGEVEAVVDVGSPDAPGGPDAEAVVGIYCARRSLLGPAARRVTPDNPQGAYRLQDVVEVLTTTGHSVTTVELHDPGEARGVNDRLQLAEVEAAIRRRTNRTWLERGVTMLDPERTYLDATVELAVDVTLFPGTILQGSTHVGPGAEIGPDSHLVDCAVGRGARVEKTVARDAEIGPRAHVGPFAALEPGAQVPGDVVTGPFYTATSSER